MGYVGAKPSAVPLTSADITDGIITSAKIADGTIVNADINASAEVVLTKLASTGTLTVDNIQFPATAVSSANANNLDDYEEGTWTPSVTPITGSFGGGNVVTSAGRYTKIGNRVITWFRFACSNIGTASNGFNFSGLPFTNSGTDTQYPPIQSINISTGDFASGAFINNSDTTGSIYKAPVNNHTYHQVAVYQI